MAEDRAQFGSSLEFILTVIGYAVGLGNVWRFPFLVFKHGGAPFLIPFFGMLFLVGIPIFFLETSIGQFSGLSPAHAFANMAPIFQGVGYAGIIINAFIGFYYNVIIGYCIHFFITSIRAKLLWADCDNFGVECYKVKNTSRDFCFDEINEYKNKNNISEIKSPSEIYFYRTVLDQTKGIDDLGHLQYQLVLALLVAWILVFLALVKGVASLGKVSYFTATFPYIIMTALVIKGALLDGADLGVNYYVGSFNATKLGDPELWKDATTQVFFALSACSGGLISMASFSAFNNNLLRDTFLVPILDILTGFYAGFAIFTVLGNMFLSKCVESFDQVAAKGPALAFVVYPEGISLMGKIAPFFSVLFFIMMLALGFGSEFSIMESLMTTVIDVLKNKINTKKKEIITRGIITVIYFSLGLTMVTQGGLYVLDLIDTFISGYPLLFVGVFQCIAVAVYGFKNFSRDIEQMIGPKSKGFWYFWYFSWVLTPLTLVAVIILSFVLPADKLNFPNYAIGIGYVITVTPLSAIPICAIYQIYKHRNNLSELIKPQKTYYLHSKKNKPNLEDLLEETYKNNSNNKITPLKECNENKGFELEKIEKKSNFSPTNSSALIQAEEESYSTRF